jgi:hypothetical protein
MTSPVTILCTTDTQNTLAITTSRYRMINRRNIALSLALLITVLLLREIVRYLFSSWLAFCVFYTMSDLYKKRKVAFKYYKMAKRYGIIPDINFAPLTPKKPSRQRQLKQA